MGSDGRIVRVSDRLKSDKDVQSDGRTVIVLTCCVNGVRRLHVQPGSLIGYIVVTES